MCWCVFRCSCIHACVYGVLGPEDNLWWHPWEYCLPALRQVLALAYSLPVRIACLLIKQSLTRPAQFCGRVCFQNVAERSLAYPKGQRWWEYLWTTQPQTSWKDCACFLFAVAMTLPSTRRPFMRYALKHRQVVVFPQSLHLRFYVEDWIGFQENGAFVYFTSAELLSSYRYCLWKFMFWKDLEVYVFKTGFRTAQAGLELKL